MNMPTRIESATHTMKDAESPLRSWRPTKENSTPIPNQEIQLQRVMSKVKEFYQNHKEIKPSHGINHSLKVYSHSVEAVDCYQPRLCLRTSMEIRMAALLHDVDDSKYFPLQNSDFENATSILIASNVSASSTRQVLEMIDLVSCSKNGNHVPDWIGESGAYHLLIPRWADRLEAVGAIGVVRCYQYNVEHSLSLSSEYSPRAACEAEVWKQATPERFEAYLASGGQSKDMISHYYDKLLHIARPPRDIVRNSYLEEMAKESSKELVEMCVRFGRSGRVDEGYVHETARQLGVAL